MQPQRRVPFATSIRVAIVDRRSAEYRSGSIEDCRLAVGRVGVALGNNTCGCRYSGDGVLMVAVIKMCGAGAGRSFADDRFVDVACVDVSIRWHARSAADWVVRDRLLFHLYIDLRATRPGSRDSASKRVVLEIHVRRPVGIDVDEQA